MKTDWAIYKAHRLPSGWCECPVCEKVRRDLEAARRESQTLSERAAAVLDVIRKHNRGRVPPPELRRWGT